jgi:hypothetical protein
MHPSLIQISNEEYHGDKSRFGHSVLLKMLKSPAHFKHYLNAPHKSSPALEFGAALHCGVLEPERFSEEFVVIDDTAFEGTLSSSEEYRLAAVSLGVRTSDMSKDQLKAAIKAADFENAVCFKEDVLAHFAEKLESQSVGALASLDEMKATASYFGIEVKGLKKDDLKAAIKAADINRTVKFLDDLNAEIQQQQTAMLAGCISTVDEYKEVATQLEIKFAAPSKDELKELIKAADTSGTFVFKDDLLLSLTEGKTVLKAEDFEAILKIRANFEEHLGVRIFLARGVAEMSYFWTDPETGINLKIRPDWLVLDSNGNILAIVDVKSAREASMSLFSRAIEAYGYDFQAAMYSDAISSLVGYHVPFYFAASEKDGPCAVACYKASDNMITVGRRKFRAALKMLSYCLENDTWPAYQSSGQIEVIDLPRYADNYEFMDEEVLLDA